MVNFREGEIRHIAPYNFLTPEVQALSHAVGVAMRQMQCFCAALPLYADVSQVPEPVLDLMALELNTQYYSQGLPRELKEYLVMQATAWHMHAGTQEALGEFLGTVFDGGYTREWHQYGGDPYCFKAYIRIGERDGIPTAYAEEIRKRIKAYKNVRSWLESLAYVLATEVKADMGAGSRLGSLSEFFTRENREFLLLDGSWHLDGTYKLNGFRSKDAAFYPPRLRISGGHGAGGTAGAGIRIPAASVRAKTRSDARPGTGSSAGGRAGITGRACAGAGIRASTGTGSRLRVEDNLWYLDGTHLLDGTKLLDAGIYEYGL